MSDTKESNDSIEIRRFKIEDYDAVLDIWQKCKLPFKPNGRDSREKISKEITKDTAIFLVAIQHDRIIGTVLGTHDGRKGWINRLAVLPGFQHKGIARRLVEEAEKILDQLGIEIIACLIEDYNHRSMDFFQGSGYTRRPDVFYFTKLKYPGV